MTDLDDLLADHVRGLRPAGRPPLAALRGRAERRRRGRLLSAAAATTGVAVAALLLVPTGGPDRVVPADPDRNGSPVDAVLLQTRDLEQTYGDTWTDGPEERGLEAGTGCDPNDGSARNGAVRAFVGSRPDLRVLSYVEDYGTVQGVRTAFGRRIDSVEACTAVAGSTKTLVNGAGLDQADTGFGMSSSPGAPDSWFAFFPSGRWLVTASITTPDSDEEQAVLAVQALAQAAKDAAED